MYAIICDARLGEELGIEHLALVDRSKTKSTWWTSDNADLILNYKKKSAALFAAKRLRKNNTKVVSYKQAVLIVNLQASRIEQNDDFHYELGWDAHKDR